jgi:CDP-4-dehydro-6-deoxyglucose reductase
VAIIHYQDRDFAVAPTESVFDCLRRNSILLSSGCKQGVCHVCMVKLVAGTVPPRAQEPLRDTLRAQGYFLACRCYPTADLTVVPSIPPFQTRAQVVSRDWLTETVLRVRFRAEHPFPYHAGQYVKLIRADGLSRSVALASLPGEDLLEIHMDDSLSQWLGAETTLTLEGPFGDSFYVAGNQQDSLLLAGNGTGLAPLYAITRDALASGHTGPIWLFHQAAGLYLTQELQALAAYHFNFHYVPVLERDQTGKLEDLIAAQLPNLAGWRAYLAGHPGTVRSLRRMLFRASVEMKAIHSNDLG